MTTMSMTVNFINLHNAKALTIPKLFLELPKSVGKFVIYHYMSPHSPTLPSQFIRPNPGTIWYGRLEDFHTVYP